MLSNMNVSDVKNKPWYRFCKVIYILIILISIIGGIFWLSRFYQTKSSEMDEDLTTINCRYGNKKTYTLKSLNISFSKKDIDDMGKMPEIWKEKLGVLLFESDMEYVSDDRFKELSKKNDLIEQKCGITEEIKLDLMSNKLNKLMGFDSLLNSSDNNQNFDKNQDFDPNQLYWIINPVYNKSNALKLTLLNTLMLGLVLLIVFLVIKWIFFYIAFGEPDLKDDKNKNIN